MQTPLVVVAVTLAAYALWALEGAEGAGSLLEKPLFRTAPTIDHVPPAEEPGAVIGPYKLIEQIGAGGMGSVWMAQQTEPVKRLVAVKLIKAGLASKTVLARFEAERQALALMDHPHIAKVLDAGTTNVDRPLRDRDHNVVASLRDADLPERGAGSRSDPTTLADSGRPYFVMELVKGIPITDYCDQHQLTPRERLELFVTVCHAVQHAHQKGVIHRDIKPTNVLVATQDGKPAPKVIDFGVAKALNQRLTEHTLATGYAQMIGTPLYMSPEQAELSPLGADTRSDIYSLGVLLYELLTGTTPFDKDRLHSASYDEMRRIIREEEPPRPSARISTLGMDIASTVAEQRRTGTKDARGDLAVAVRNVFADLRHARGLRKAGDLLGLLERQRQTEQRRALAAREASRLAEPSRCDARPAEDPVALRGFGGPGIGQRRRRHAQRHG